MFSLYHCRVNILVVALAVRRADVISLGASIGEANSSSPTPTHTPRAHKHLHLWRGLSPCSKELLYAIMSPIRWGVVILQHGGRCIWISASGKRADFGLQLAGFQIATTMHHIHHLSCNHIERSMSR